MGKLKRSLEVENNYTASVKLFHDEDDNEIDVIDISSSDSSHSDELQNKQYVPMPGLPGNKRAKFVFIPLGPASRKRVAELFKINFIKELPNYSGCMLNCPQMKPKSQRNRWYGELPV